MELNQKENLKKRLLISNQSLNEAKDDQLKLNESLEKIMTWLVGFIFVFLGVLISNIDKICIKHFKSLFLLLGLTIIFGTLSRVFSYLFSLSFMSALNLFNFEIKLGSNLSEEDINDLEVSEKANEIVSSYAPSSKGFINKNVNLYKNFFVLFSSLTFLFFIISVIVLILKIYFYF
ncbi:hypothetical protein [Polaribacter uvawellassae]|uniref:hypothetical protein n=1 Tax=Polaribacter uvawellassae TaxID=3133495 RepID=UPI00321B5416